MTDYALDNERLDRAIKFAVEKHAGQLRKGTNRPYIIHPLEVLSILMRMNADTNLLAAGVLHDTVEDTDTSLEEIVELFGEDIGALVAFHSEDKGRTWDERKLHTIESLRGADHRRRMLVMADKLSNLRSIAADYRELGDELWSRFNAPRAQQSWYYSGILDSLQNMQNDPSTSDAYWELNALYKDVFVNFYRTDLDRLVYNCLLQVSAHGEAYCLDEGNPLWYKVDISEFDPRDFIPISRRELEMTEDEWRADCSA